MKFIADESLDKQIVDRLRADGHIVEYIAEISPGATDDHVRTMANQEEALLLTADKDFGELIFRQQRISQGVILVRLASLVAFEISAHQAKLSDAFCVITPGAVCVRRRLGG